MTPLKNIIIYEPQTQHKSKLIYPLYFPVEIGRFKVAQVSTKIKVKSDELLELLAAVCRVDGSVVLFQAKFYTSLSS